MKSNEEVEEDETLEAIAEVPEVSGAMDAITAAIVPLREWINNPPPPPSGTP